MCCPNVKTVDSFDLKGDYRASAAFVRLHLGVEWLAMMHDACLKAQTNRPMERPESQYLLGFAGIWGRLHSHEHQRRLGARTALLS